MEIFEGTIQAYAKTITEVEKKFNYEVGAAPITSLPTAEIVNEVFKAHTDLIKANGTYSQVEYVGTSTAKWGFAWLQGNSVSKAIVAAKNAFYAKHDAFVDRVYRNLPPARVHHMLF